MKFKWNLEEDLDEIRWNLDEIRWNLDEFRWNLERTHFTKFWTNLDTHTSFIDKFNRGRQSASDKFRQNFDEFRWNLGEINWNLEETFSQNLDKN